MAAAGDGPWDELGQAAGLGGLLLDWWSWHLPGEAAAPPEVVRALCAALGQAAPPRVRGAEARPLAVRHAVGAPCAEVWPRAVGRYAYAGCRLWAAASCRAALRLGSYVGFRAWLDGALVLAAGAGEAFEPDDNLALLPLAPGEHTLLVEVDREAWETVFHARLSAPDGRDLPPGQLRIRRVGSRPTRPVATAEDVYADAMREAVAPALDRLSAGEWEAWQAGWRRGYRRLLGEVPRAARAAEEEPLGAWEGLALERVTLHGGPAGGVPLWCLWPPRARRQPVPALLCIHGHGAGKDDVAGRNAEDPAHAARVAAHRYAYGLEFARRGYAVFAPDLLGFGERRAPGPPQGGRDPCDNDFFKAVLAGLLPLALHLADLQAVVDYALGRPEVRPGPVGCVGLSLGGRMAMYLAALDDRLGVTVVSGALNLFRERLTSGASCGNQLLPGLWRYGDTPEVFALLAPRPLLLELGTQDGTSPEVFAAEAWRRVRRAWALAGAPSALEVDVFRGGHRFSGRRAFAFVERWLPAGGP